MILAFLLGLLVGCVVMDVVLLCLFNQLGPPPGGWT